ncbi:MAG: DNA polymerase III subunit delta [Clostridia bacterium]|nr:DNA polymerase III subunit delta [Clostridia bacterium]
MADALSGEIKTVAEMKQHLSSGLYAPAYLLFGDETYLKELYLGRLKKALADDENNIITFSGDTDVPRLEEEIGGISLFGDRKLIIVRDCEWFKKAGDVSFLEGLEGTGTSVVFSENSVDRRSAAFKAFLKHGIVFECSAAEETDIKKLLAAEAKNAGRILTPDAAALMIGGLGTDITSLLNELEKLILTVPEGGRIEEKHVRKVCSLSPAARIFDLTDAVTRGDTGSALKLLHALTDGQERDRGSALGVLAMLFRNWENILKVKLLLAEGFSESEIQKITVQKPYPVKKQCEQSRKLSFDELRKKLRYLMDLDQAIKSGNIDESLALSLAVSG